MLIDISITANDGRQAQAAVSWYVNNKLHTDDVTFDRCRDASGRHRLIFDDLPLAYVDEVFGELLEAVLVKREENDREENDRLN